MSNVPQRESLSDLFITQQAKLTMLAEFIERAVQNANDSLCLTATAAHGLAQALRGSCDELEKWLQDTPQPFCDYGRGETLEQFLADVNGGAR